MALGFAVPRPKTAQSLTQPETAVIPPKFSRFFYHRIVQRSALVSGRPKIGGYASPQMPHSKVGSHLTHIIPPIPRFALGLVGHGKNYDLGEQNPDTRC